VGIAEERLALAGYSRHKRNLWTNGPRRIQVVHSIEYYRDSIRITWKEEWQGYHAIIFDYSPAQGPVCIVPATVLFRSPFVDKKRNEPSYANSGYWWSQRFPTSHELSRLVLKYANKYELI
jgi:hypothetical protein